MLIGYSFGANVLPFAWPKLQPETQARVRLFALLAPENKPRSTFPWRVARHQDWQPRRA